jgi:hypothetical protein
VKTPIIVMLAALTLNAQAPSPKANPATSAMEKPAPVIPDALRARWWRSVANLTAAQAQMKGATDAANAARAEIDAVCASAPGYAVSGDSDGEPVCAPKPAPVKP